MIGQFAAIEVLLIDRKRRLRDPIHSRTLSRYTVKYRFGSGARRSGKRRAGRRLAPDSALAAGLLSGQLSEIKVPIKSAGQTRLTGALVNAAPNDGSPWAMSNAIW